MHRGAAFACALFAPALAHAEPTELGGWFGPRIYSADSALGYIDDAPAHPFLVNAIELGARASRQFFPWPWLVPELELAVAPTHTNMACAPGGLCAQPANVIWIEPRFQLRVELQ